MNSSELSSCCFLLPGLPGTHNIAATGAAADEVGQVLLCRPDVRHTRLLLLLLLPSTWPLLLPAVAAADMPLLLPVVRQGDRSTCAYVGAAGWLTLACGWPVAALPLAAWLAAGLLPSVQ